MNELRNIKIHMLEYAIKHMHKHNGICYALEKYSENITIQKGVEFKAWDELTDYIIYAMGYHINYYCWLQDHHPQLKLNHENVSDGRIAWCKWIIQCLKEDQAKEDAK